MIDWIAALALAICPQPYVGDLSVRPVSEDGERIALRARTEIDRGGIGSFQVWWGNHGGLIADGWWGRRGTANFEHRFPGPGTYRITVTVNGSTEGCRRLQTSPPATLRVTVPATATSRPSSL